MRRERWIRWGILVAGGAVLFQGASCIALELIQTVLLGISAAGAIGILRNL